MLVLTRRVNESLMIGDNIEIKVLATKGNQVRIGIDAPKDVGVHRKDNLPEREKKTDYRNRS